MILYLVIGFLIWLGVSQHQGYFLQHPMSVPVSLGLTHEVGAESRAVPSEGG